MTSLTKQQFTIPTPEMAALFEKYIGPGRFTRSAYRVREQADINNSFGINAFDKQILVGTVSFTPLDINGDNSACLLGPLLVAPDYRSKGLGLELMQDGIELAKTKGFAVTLLVGDVDYYQKIGFERIDQQQIIMPGPVDPGRFLGLAMQEGALKKLKGLVRGI